MQPRSACRVQAGNAEGNGEFSSEAACSTAKPPPPAPTSVIAYVAAEHAGGCFNMICHDDADLLPGMVTVGPCVGAQQSNTHGHVGPCMTRSQTEFNLSHASQPLPCGVCALRVFECLVVPLCRSRGSLVLSSSVKRDASDTCLSRHPVAQHHSAVARGQLRPSLPRLVCFIRGRSRARSRRQRRHDPAELWAQGQRVRPGKRSARCIVPGAQRPCFECLGPHTVRTQRGM